MEVKEAVQTAKDYIRTIYSDEGIRDIGLEEVKFKQGPPTWDVTIGFIRPFSGEALAPLASVLQTDPRRRVYKIVRIDERDGRVVAMLHRAIGDEQ